VYAAYNIGVGKIRGEYIYMLPGPVCELRAQLDTVVLLLPGSELLRVRLYFTLTFLLLSHNHPPDQQQLKTFYQDGSLRYRPRRCTPERSFGV
jgi:hypothetical protein